MEERTLKKQPHTVGLFVPWKMKDILVSKLTITSKGEKQLHDEGLEEIFIVRKVPGV